MTHFTKEENERLEENIKNNAVEHKNNIFDYYKNNEIKEILDKLKSNNYPFGIATIDMDKLIDYITNLQEIAEEHKNCTRKHWQQKCAEHCANEMIYKSRNEKAIEYIKGWQSFPHTNGSTHNELRNLLNILNGGDEDE